MKSEFRQAMGFLRLILQSTGRQLSKTVSLFRARAKGTYHDLGLPIIQTVTRTLRWMGFAGAAATALIVFALIKASHHEIVIEPVLVPIAIQSYGYDSGTLSRWTEEKLKAIYRDAEDDPAATENDQNDPKKHPFEEPKLPDIEVPGVGLSLQTLVHIFEKLPFSAHMHISTIVDGVDIGKVWRQSTTPAKSSSSEHYVHATVRAMQGGDILTQQTLQVWAGPEALVLAISEVIVEQTNRGVFAAYLARRQPARALGLIRQMELDPKKYRNELAPAAVALYRMDQMKRADEMFRQAIRFNSGDASLYRNYVNFLVRSGGTDTAVEYGRKAASLAPKDPKSYETLGGVFESTGKIPDAIETYRRGIKMAPGHLGLYERLSSVLRKQQRENDARVNLELYVKQHPGDALSYLALGRELASQGLWDKAEGVLEQALELEPRMSSGYELLLMRPGIDAAAEADILQRAIKQMPSDLTMYVKLARVYEHRLCDVITAEGVYRAALRAMPHDFMVYHALADFLETHDRLDESIDLLRRASEELDASPDVTILLAGALWRKGDRTSARMAYQQAAERELFQGNIEVSYLPNLGLSGAMARLADQELAGGALSEALAALNKANRQGFSYSKLVFGLATALVAKGRVDEATRLLREHLDYTSRDFAKTKEELERPLRVKKGTETPPLPVLPRRKPLPTLGPEAPEKGSQTSTGCKLLPEAVLRQRVASRSPTFVEKEEYR